jgi:hypothetical protein
MSREGNLKGAAREMSVALDLMSHDFEVFRPLSTATCDLIALKYGISLRIEVKGVHGHCRKPSGPVTTRKSRGGNNPDCELFDILVRFNDNEEMFYQRSALHSINKASADLPLREEFDKNVSNKVRERALSMTEKNA